MAISSLADLTDQLLAKGLASHPRVIAGRERVAAVSAELTAVRARRAVRQAERDDLRAWQTAGRLTGRAPNDIEQRVLAIDEDLLGFAAAEQQLAAQKADLDRELRVIVKEARAEELVALEGSARQIASAMLPLVEQLHVLNQELSQVRDRAGYRSDWPTPFGTGAPVTAQQWLVATRQFASKGTL